MNGTVHILCLRTLRYAVCQFSTFGEIGPTSQWVTRSPVHSAFSPSTCSSRFIRYRTTDDVHPIFNVAGSHTLSVRYRLSSGSVAGMYTSSKDKLRMGVHIGPCFLSLKTCVNSMAVANDHGHRHLTVSTKAILEASPMSLQPYLKLIRFDRPIGTWLLFLPCTWSISLAAPAGHLPDARMLALFALGSFSMRAAACTINDMWDKDYDAQVLRTRDRPLASGQISQFRALTFLAVPLSVSLGILLTFNYNTIALGACSMIPCIIYPLMKRVTYWPQAFLGITLNWGVLIAWSAIHGSLDLSGVVLYLSCVLWTMIYDTIYAHQDKADDIHVGVKSTALKFGDNSKKWLSAFATGVTGGLTAAGYLCEQPWLYYAGVGTVMLHLAHQIHSVDLSDPESCGQTFRANRNLGLIFWAFIVGAGLMADGKT